MVKGTNKDALFKYRIFQISASAKRIIYPNIPALFTGFKGRTPMKDNGSKKDRLFTAVFFQY